MTQRNAQNAQNAKEFTNQTKAAAASGGAEHQRDGAGDAGDSRSASSEMRDAMNAIKRRATMSRRSSRRLMDCVSDEPAGVERGSGSGAGGEAGMGFTVVADEVRSLAQRSAKAAKETADMIETSVKRSEDGVRVTDKVAVAVQEVVTLPHLGKLAEILTKVQQVDEQVVQIASASQEQSRGIMK